MGGLTGLLCIGPRSRTEPSNFKMLTNVRSVRRNEPIVIVEIKFKIAQASAESKNSIITTRNKLTLTARHFIQRVRLTTVNGRS